MAGKIIRVFTALLFLAGLGVLLYPAVSNAWNEYLHEQLIKDYQNQVTSISERERRQIFEEALDYNAHHQYNTVIDVFDNEMNKPSRKYDTLLNPAGDGIMGYIEIPGIKQRLIIYHGTGASVLEKGIGHVEGTGLPVGGESNHAVLAGHRGLPTAKLFSDLDQLTIGDVFYIHVVDQTLAYEVDQIKIVEPDELKELEIIAGEDLVTLLTCTPYGVNTQRLLIRGHRIPYVEQTTENSKEDADSGDLRFIILVAAGVTLTMILLAVIKKKFLKKAGRKEENQDE